jgi:hypothetical protein
LQLTTKTRPHEPRAIEPRLASRSRVEDSKSPGGLERAAGADETYGDARALPRNKQTGASTPSTRSSTQPTTRFVSLRVRRRSKRALGRTSDLDRTTHASSARTLRSPPAQRPQKSRPFFVRARRARFDHAGSSAPSDEPRARSHSSRGELRVARCSHSQRSRRVAPHSAKRSLSGSGAAPEMAIV